MSPGKSNYVSYVYLGYRTTYQFPGRAGVWITVLGALVLALAGYCGRLAVPRLRTKLTW